MRYLHKRNEFLFQQNILSSEKNFDVNQQIKTSSLINETFENDITWGGSMIGRLINSTIRRFKIGYAQTQVGPLLNKLEDEMNYLISSSIQGDTLKKYNELRIRAYFEEIRNTCLSNQPEPDKLVELLGQSTGLYDPNDPTKNQRTMGMVQEAIDVITDDLKDLKKLLGQDRDRLIDKLSDFNDDLRKLTVSQGTPVQPTQQTAVNNFNLNFLNTLNSLSNSGLITSSFKFHSFAEFVNERAGDDAFAKWTDEQFEDWVKANPGAEERARKIRSKLKGEKQPQSSTGVSTVQKPSASSEEKDTPSGQVPSVTNKKTDVVGGSDKAEEKQPTEQPAQTSQITKKQIEEVINILKTKKKKEIISNPLVKKLLTDIETKLPKDKLSTIEVEYGDDKLTFPEAIQNIKSEFVKESNYIIIEASSNMGGQPGGATASSGSSSSSSSQPTTVKGIWDLYEFDKDRSVTRLTQREVDELNGLLTKGTQNLRYDPEKRPDPIVSISRIFGEAHNLYFTDVIPSGRPNGRISQKTFREYVKLGKGPGKWVQGESPEGPFAVKSIFSKWRTGVEKLLMNQEYRKILANVKFVVPGAEDKFNDSFDTKIFEADEPVTKTQSQGQVLFEFMNNMLDKNKLDDFDTLRSTLMNKYFGLTLSDKDKKTEGKTEDKQPSKEDFEPNVVYFTSLQIPKINITNGVFYAIPIKKIASAQGKVHDLIFMQVIKNITVDRANDAILVKFTYNDPTIMDKYADKIHDTKKYVSWGSTRTPEKNLYYGLIQTSKTNLTNGSKFTLVYGNVNNSEVTDVYKNTFMVEEGVRDTKSGQVKVKPSKLVFNDDSKVNNIIKPFEIKLMTNDEFKHVDNLNKNVKSVNKKLIDALKDEFKNI
jgi:hypothetical protein